MIIDGHAHACGEYYSETEILKVLNANNASKVVLCPGEAGSRTTYHMPCLAEKFPNKDFMFFINNIVKLIISMTKATRHINQQNNYIYELCKKLPERIIQAYWANPLEIDCIKKIDEDYKKYHFKILKLHQCWHKFDFESQNIDDIMKWTNKHSIPMFIHIGSKKQMQKFIQKAKKYPNNIFIIAHLIGYKEISEALRGNNNIYYEISPPELIPLNKLKAAILDVGTDKLILGSDTPYGKDNLAKNIARVNSLNITEEEKQLIKGETIRRLLKIE